MSQVTGGFVRSDDGEAAQQVSTAKLDVLEDILDTVIEEGKKVVIFARFIPEIRAIEKLLKRKQIGYALVCGEVKDRAEQVSNFQINPDTKAFVGQLQTTGMGLTLTAASVAVFYSLDFNFANYEQSRARIHRIGQDKKCLYIHLVAKGTVDQKIYKPWHTRDVATLVVTNEEPVMDKRKYNQQQRVGPPFRCSKHGSNTDDRCYHQKLTSAYENYGGGDM